MEAFISEADSSMDSRAVQLAQVEAARGPMIALPSPLVLVSKGLDAQWAEIVVAQVSCHLCG